MELEFFKELTINCKAQRSLLLEQGAQLPFPLSIPAKAHGPAHRQFAWDFPVTAQGNWWERTFTGISWRPDQI